jgi:hypothetical protein
MTRFLRQPIDDVLAALEPVVAVRSPLRALGLFIVAMAAAWFVYVPIHELLHAFGCVLAGGEVSRLEIAPKYGGALWARLFPFVVSGGDYAGRLSGFDWKGSDGIYLATDFMPYVLTVVIGVPLIKRAGRRRRPVVFALGVVVGLAPFYSLPGDYFEMGSIVTTRAVSAIAGPPDRNAEPAHDDMRAGAGSAERAGPQVAETAAAAADKARDPALRFAGLRSDDVFLLLATVIRRPAEVGLDTTGRVAAGLVIIVLSCLVALLLALVTYWLGHVFSVVIWRLPGRPGEKAP